LLKSDIALPVFQRALEIYTGVYGMFSKEVAACNSGIGLVMLQSGDMDQAVFYFQKSLSLLETRYGPESIKLVDILQNLSYAFLGRYDDFVTPFDFDFLTFLCAFKKWECTLIDCFA
jgi:hypothetical protein